MVQNNDMPTVPWEATPIIHGPAWVRLGYWSKCKRHNFSRYLSCSAGTRVTVDVHNESIPILSKCIFVSLCIEPHKASVEKNEPKLCMKYITKNFLSLGATILIICRWNVFYFRDSPCFWLYTPYSSIISEDFISFLHAIAKFTRKYYCCKNKVFYRTFTYQDGEECVFDMYNRKIT